jgi:hypothetical protein
MGVTPLLYVKAAIIVALSLGCIKLGSWYTQTAWDKEKLSQMAANESESLRRVDAQKEVQREAQKSIDRLRADAGLAGAAAERLRQRTAAVVAAGSATAAGSSATDDPIGVLALVFGRADDRAGILAAYADQARAAGLACESAYRSLTK